MTDGADNSPSKHTTDATKSGAVSLPFERAGGRKFCLVVGASLLYTALLAWGLLDQYIYQNLQMVTIGAYIAGNAAIRFAEKPNANRNPD